MSKGRRGGHRGSRGGPRGVHRGHRGGRRIPPPMPPIRVGDSTRWPWWHGGYRRWWYRPSWYNLSPYYAPAWAWYNQPLEVQRVIVKERESQNWLPIILSIIGVMIIIYLFIDLFK